MREILFRGKRKDTKEWIEGCYIKSVVANSPFAYIAPSYPSEPVRVYSKTVGQYAGLDKNGTKIFEGDVLKYTPLPRKSIVYEVIWQEERSRFALKTVGNGINLYEWLEKDKANCCCEIIGNIHDNPELLKGGEG